MVCDYPWASYIDEAAVDEWIMLCIGTPLVLGSSLSGYCTLCTELLTDSHHNSIINLSICWFVLKVGEGFPGRVWPKTVKWVVMYISVTFHTTTGRPCVCILWRGGVSCPVSAAWHSCVAAHWLKYHCYKQAQLWYDLRCLKVTLNPNNNKNAIYAYSTSWYPRSTNLCTETVVDCVSKPRIFIQCSCMIAPPRGYE